MPLQIPSGCFFPQHRDGVASGLNQSAKGGLRVHLARQPLPEGSRGCPSDRQFGIRE